MRLAALALIAFGFAQAGAVAHAYTHDATLRAVTQPGDRFLDRPVSAGHAACDACLAYAPLLSASGVPPDLAFILSPAPVAAWNRPGRSHVDGSLILAFRSRAPPAA